MRSVVVVVVSLDLFSRRRGRFEAAIGSSKRSSPTKRSEGSKRRGVSTWKVGLHSLITLKASEWGISALLIFHFHSPQISFSSLTIYQSKNEMAKSKIAIMLFQEKLTFTSEFPRRALSLALYFL